jgi:soluble lytic murein transglycosylase
MHLLKRLALAAVILLILAGGALFLFNRFWIHRYDEMIQRQAAVYRLDPDLVWSVIHEETYFRPWKLGEDGEIGLMQVTPGVGRDWAEETGMREFEQQMRSDPSVLLRDPERNIQIGCWYLEKISKEYRDTPGAEARVVAGYNAGPRRAQEWNRTAPGRAPLTAEEFIARIDIPSTRAYVTNIITRYREMKDSRQSAGGSRQ